jgi:uncharacterized protein YndB with AHSA1/START domain
MEARNSAAASVGEADNLELVITRIFDAPRSLVFKVWTDPDHMVRWFGPKGFTSSIVGKLDVCPGASYRIHMRGPDGDDHWSQGAYREIVEPERLVFAGCWADAEGKPKGPESTVTVTLEDLGGKTRLTLRQRVFESVTARDAHHGGWTSSLERLAEYLATV